MEKYNDKKQFNDAQKSRVENTGILIAAGLIAGEALIGLLFAAFAFWEVSLFAFFAEPSFIISLIVFSFIGWLLVNIPLKNAGKPDDPPPPHVSM